jgi:predicted Holliday junction resolvase-like endonuclease
MIFRKSNIFFFLLILVPVFYSLTPQESHVNQKKIERDKARKQKEAQKQYDKAVKRHQQSQSKETRTRMKETKKKSKKVTPLPH